MDYYLLTLVVLGILAVTDLTVGVANDAVNFLNSGVGSRAASFKKILFVAALGVLVGVFFSSGMMDVAKTGIINPQYYVLSEVLLIFVAVMFTDLLLLDLFNTFGLPTSTTVSVVAGMFGSALFVTFMKITTANESLSNIAVYLNIASLFKIFSAILLSIAFAFIFGFLVQYITRLIFTFDYKVRFRRYGAIWAGISLTILSYFILLKGAKGASFLIELGITDWIFGNIPYILLGSLVFWTILFQLILFFFKNANILKFIVLLGTFSLAMSFAANDLVNFIGPPLAGLTAYFTALGSPDVGAANMAGLATVKIKAETWMLLASGAIMVLTLYFSKKTRTVIQTEVGLGRQSEGDESFDSNLIARGLVRMVINFVDIIKMVVPNSVIRFVNKRFDTSLYKPVLDENGVAPSFDLLRAAVILIVSSGLISFATSLKLPLSTTYVTFIVAMAAALPDKAWGRDSAVYRVAGVITVVFGWFFTAFMAAFVSAIIAMIIYYGHVYGLAGMVLFTAFVLFRSSKFHKQKEIEKSEDNNIESSDEDDFEVKSKTAINLKSVSKDTASYISIALEMISESYKGLVYEDIRLLKKQRLATRKLNRKLNSIMKKTVDFIKTDMTARESEYVLTHMISLCQDVTDKSVNLAEQNFSYLDNNHNKLFDDQKNEILDLIRNIEEMSVISGKLYKKSYILTKEELLQKEIKFRELLSRFHNNQLLRIKKMAPSMKRNILIFNILNDIEGIGLSTLKLFSLSVKIKEFITSSDNVNK